MKNLKNLGTVLTKTPELKLIDNSEHCRRIPYSGEEHEFVFEFNRPATEEEFIDFCLNQCEELIWAKKAIEKRNEPKDWYETTIAVSSNFDDTVWHLMFRTPYTD